MLRKDPSQWQHPYDRMTDKEKCEERARLDEWRKTAAPSPSWFLPPDDE